MRAWKNKARLLSAVLLAAILIGGCGSGAATEDETNLRQGQQGEEVSQQAENGRQQAEENGDEADEQPAQATQYPLVIQDATGEEFTFEAAPEKIVSVSPSETEILFALGLDDRIVGVSDLDDYPEAALSKPKMGNIMAPNEEALLAAEADVVFTGISINPAALENLRSLGIKVFKVDAKTVEDVMQNIRTIGKITDRQAEAQAVVDEMKADVERVTEAVRNLNPEEKVDVYLEFAPGWTVGSGEFIDEMIRLAGGVNIAADQTGWYEISEEAIIQTNPDVILYDGTMVDENNQTLEQIIRGRSGWDEIDAVREGRMYGLDSNLLTRPGPRVTKGLIEIAKSLYPDLVR
jgi:iron complex transport system substrate-binding protein